MAAGGAARLGVLAPRIIDGFWRLRKAAASQQGQAQRGLRAAADALCAVFCIEGLKKNVEWGKWQSAELPSAWNRPDRCRRFSLREQLCIPDLLTAQSSNAPASTRSHTRTGVLPLCPKRPVQCAAPARFNREGHLWSETLRAEGTFRISRKSACNAVDLPGGSDNRPGCCKSAALSDRRPLHF